MNQGAQLDFGALDEPAIDREEADDVHLECCRDEDLALCGADLTGAEIDENSDDDCELCCGLDDQIPDECTGCPAMRMKNLLEDL